MLPIGHAMAVASQDALKKLSLFSRPFIFSSKQLEGAHCVYLFILMCLLVFSPFFIAKDLIMVELIIHPLCGK